MRGRPDSKACTRVVREKRLRMRSLPYAAGREFPGG